MLRWHPFVGGTYTGGVNVACNGSNINPVALNLLNQKIKNGTYLIPTPQRLTTDANGNPIGVSTFSIPSTYFEGQYLVNTDFVLSPKHTLSERFFYAGYPEDQPLGTAGDTPGNGVSTAFVSQLAVLKLTSALNSHLLNEALVGYIRSSGHLQTESTLTASQIGMTAPSDPSYPLYPVTSVTGYFSLGGGGNDESSSVVNTFQVDDQISWTRGKQSIRAGFIGEKNQFDFNDPEQKRGTLGFSTFQDFLLGMSATQNGTAFSNINSAGSQQGSYYKGYRGTDMSVLYSGRYQTASKPDRKCRSALGDKQPGELRPWRREQLLAISCHSVSASACLRNFERVCRSKQLSVTHTGGRHQAG